MDAKNVIAALTALAQESRLAVFRLLVQAGPEGLAASKISESVGVPPSSLSFHLKEMSHANLLTSRQDGRFVIYAANYDTMNQLMGFLTENCCGGNPCTSVSTCTPEGKTVSETTA
ncbi:MAG: metalloregulator ArsR/SmtB family transcription factor [Burkholderiaceae bacterium]|nr:metalloregulator ArsR/SmtB family transcription factor [Burkholderiaceae bacterium]